MAGWRGRGFAMSLRKHTTRNWQHGLGISVVVVYHATWRHVYLSAFESAAVLNVEVCVWASWCHYGAQDGVWNPKPFRPNTFV